MSDDLDIDAAEYVLGTLDATERDIFAQRLLADDAAKAALAQWDFRLYGLTAKISPIVPDPRVWTAIEKRLPSSGAKIHGFKVIDGGGRSTSRVDGGPFKQSRDRWRAAAIASGALAASLVVLVVGRELRSTPEAPSNIYVAAVNRGGDRPALIVRVDLKTRQVFVRPVATETPEGRSLELWYIGDGRPPRSMGLVDKVSETLPIPRGAQDDAATFAVTVEPVGGSKTGGPTGPIVYSGQLVKE